MFWNPRPGQTGFGSGRKSLRGVWQQSHLWTILSGSDLLLESSETDKKKNLYQVMDLPAPAPSLFETAQFFMKLLPPRYQERLARVAGVMNKRILRVGTACSGSDICMVAIRALLQAMNKEFNVSKQDHTECSKCTLFPTRTMIGETRATRSMQYIYRVVNGVCIYIYIVVWSCVYCHSLTILRLRLACATSFQLKRTRKRLTTYLQLIRR